MSRVQVPFPAPFFLINHEKIRTLRAIFRAIFAHHNLLGSIRLFHSRSSHAIFDLPGGGSFATLSLLAGVGGSFIFGQQSVRKAAKDIIKPHARSAFRRLLSLYHSLSRVAATIESSQTSSLPVENQVTLAKLEAIVVEQLASADDAIEEWKDIVPEDVEELDQRFSSDKTTRDRQ